MIRFSTRVFATAIGVALLSSAALAADPAPQPPVDPTPAQRKEMASVHRKMADCLDSNRSFAECRTEMQSSCVQLMGQNGCPMMMGGGGMMGRGGMMGGPGGPPPTTSPK
jgi:hypothetical protein